MSIEGSDASQEKEPVVLSNEDWMRYSQLEQNDPDLVSWMEEKGISFDSGLIDITLDGVKKKMVTSRGDFMTTTGVEEEVIPSGY